MRRSLRTRVALLLVAAVATNAACSTGGGGQGKPTTSAPSSDATVPEWLDDTELVTLDDGVLATQARRADEGLTEMLLAATGLLEDEAAGDALQELNLAMAETVPADTSDSDATPDPIPGAASLRAPRSQFAFLQAGYGLAMPSILVNNALSHSRRHAGTDLGSSDGEVEPRPTDGKVDVRTVERTSHTDEAGRTVTMETVAEASVEACPDAEGHVEGSFKTDTAVTFGGGSASVSGRMVQDVSFSGVVGDDAHLIEVDFDSKGSVTETASGTTDSGKRVIQGFHVEASLGARRTGGLATAGQLEGVRGSVTRASSQVPSALKDGFVQVQANATSVPLTFMLQSIESHWREGACVEARITPDAGPSGLEPNARVQVVGEGFSKVDGRPVGGTAVASLVEGVGTVSGDGEAGPSPISFTFTASDSKPGRVELTVTSRRGIGSTREEFTVQTGWSIDAAAVGDDRYHFVGSKCGSPGGRWELAVTGDIGGFPFTGRLVADVDADTLTGPFEMTGTYDVEGMPIDQRATGTVTVDVEAEELVLVTTGNTMTAPDAGASANTDATAPIPMTYGC